MTISLETLKEACAFLSDRYSVKTNKVNSELKELAALANPNTLDEGDLFILLSHPDKLASIEQGNSYLRQYLGYSQKDPDGVRLEFSSLVSSADHSVLAKTKIIPQNVDRNKSPIVFAGGLFHATPVYLDFLTKLAKKTHREILAFDSPGVGGSHFSQHSITHKRLQESLVQVVESEYHDKPVIVMGHSLGTTAVRDLYAHPENLAQSVEKYVMIAPIPAAEEETHGLIFSRPYMVGASASLVKHNGKLAPEKNDGEQYFNEHLDKERMQLEQSIKRERFPTDFPNYLGVLAKIHSESVWDQLGEDNKLVIVLAENDRIMKLKNPQAWQDKGAIILKGADHSFLAGQNISDEWVDAIAAQL